MTHPEEKAALVSVTNDDPETVSVFWNLGRAYLSGLPSDEREKFLQSILARQEESDRWLLLLRYGNEYIGFVHMKIDRDERPGWGFILEFYIAQNKRKSGFGRRLFNLIVKIMRARNVKNIWLLANQPAAEMFWRSLGLKETGEIDLETGQKVFVIPI